jgi:spore coat polysaccharide biosynthesis predicted glycosyltransferase SpsG
LTTITVLPKKNPRNDNQVLFRVDGGRIPGLSLGHVFRCLALAGELRDRHAKQAVFMMRDFAEGVSVVEAHGFPVERLAAETAPEEEAALLAKRNEETIVFDLPNLADGSLGALSEAGRRVVVLDDLGGRRFSAHMVINGSVVTEALDYPEDCGVEYRLGPAYCVLGEGFDGKRRRRTNPEVESILVTFGGSDPTGLTQKTARLLAGMGIRATIHLVMGPGYGDEKELSRIAVKGQADFRLHRNVADLAAMMLEADLAISAAGRTAYELAATGTPVLLVPSIDHECSAARAFSEKGTALVVDGRGEDAVRENLSRLLGDVGLREAMRRNGPEIVDGRGRQRVAGLLAT